MRSMSSTGQRPPADDGDEPFQSTIERAAIGIAHVDVEGRFIHANRWLCELLGYAREELVGMTVKQVSHPEDRDVTDGVRAKLRAGLIDSFQTEKRYLRKDGSAVWFGLTISLKRGPLGEPLHDIAVMQDVSARKRAEEELRRSNERFRSLVNLSSDWFWEQDAEFRFTTFEGQGVADHGDVSVSAVIGKRPWELAGVVETSVDWEQHRARLLRHEPFRDFEYAYRDRKGKVHYISANGEPVFDERGAFAGYHGTTRDVTERKLNDERIRHLATHDGLTGLPNRVMFSQMLNFTIESSRRYGRRFAVLFIDLDGFKAINDSLGHEAGDTLLCEVAARLKKALRASDVVARLGGDEFVALLQEVAHHEQMAHAARKILSAVIEPVEIAGRACGVTASIGGSMYPDDAADERSLMKNADGAMYRAKQDGKNAFRCHGEGA